MMIRGGAATTLLRFCATNFRRPRLRTRAYTYRDRKVPRCPSPVRRRLDVILILRLLCEELVLFRTRVRQASMHTFSRVDRRLIRGAGRSVSYCGVRLIALLPRRWWYPALWRISRVQAVLMRPIIRCTSYRSDHKRAVPVAWILNYWISRLASARGAFTMPIRVKGSELIRDLFRNPTGAAVCSAHVPLLDLCLQSLMDMGCPPAAVIAGPKVLVDSWFPVLGKPALPGLPMDLGVLLKVRTVLRNGGFVAALVDLDVGTYSPNLFRVVRLTGAKVVFVIPELRPNGDIDVEFFLPPDPSCQSEQSIDLNLQVLGSRIDRVLRLTPQSEKPKAAVPVRSDARDPPDTAKVIRLQ